MVSPGLDNYSRQLLRLDVPAFENGAGFRFRERFPTLHNSAANSTKIVQPGLPFHRHLYRIEGLLPALRRRKQNPSQS
jgi:hypothetical protein